MTYFTRQGNTFRISDEEAMEVTKHLPVGNYIVQYNQMTGQFFLEGVDAFSFTGKHYGDLDRNVERILNTFHSRKGATGVMLTGEKGSGKSLLAKMLSIVGAEKGVPTLIINSPFSGDLFNKFIQDIDQECIILLDEFEKTYESKDQQMLLTLLDGMFSSKKLFVLTCNDKYRVDSHMRNRPGRIFYMIDFSGLGQDFIREYCQDRLEQKEHIDAICRVSALLPKFTFDQLQALVEEMNRYKEPPEEALAMLNVKPEFNEDERFKVSIITPDGVEVPEGSIHEQVWRGNPLQMRGYTFSYMAEKSDDEWSGVRVSTSDIVSINPEQGQYVLKSQCGHTVLLTRPKPLVQSYYGLVA